MYEIERSFLKDCFQNVYATASQLERCVSEKGDFDVVTNVDVKIEKEITRLILSRFPQDTIHSEEFRSDVVLKDRTWILDPIDGTYNFSARSPHFGLQGAFLDQGELQFSVIYLPAFCDMYEAIRNRGAFCNGKRIRVSERKPKDAIVSFGDLPHHRPEDVRDQTERMKGAFPKVARLRMFGASSVDFSYLAAGKTEGVVLFTKNKWDIAPGLLLAKEAGAYLSDPDFHSYSFQCRGIVAANSEELCKILTLQGDSYDSSQ